MTLECVGLLPVLADEQEALRWSLLDAAGSLGQDGHQGHRGTTLPVLPLSPPLFFFQSVVSRAFLVGTDGAARQLCDGLPGDWRVPEQDSHREERRGQWRNLSLSLSHLFFVSPGRPREPSTTQSK